LKYSTLKFIGGKMKAIILAAGNSTRLQPLTNNCPKPMLKVCGKPMLEHIILQLSRFGFKEIIVTTHFAAEAINAYFDSPSCPIARAH